MIILLAYIDPESVSIETKQQIDQLAAALKQFGEEEPVPPTTTSKVSAGQVNIKLYKAIYGTGK